MRRTINRSCTIGLVAALGISAPLLAEAAEEGGDLSGSSAKKICPNLLPANVQEKTIKCPDSKVATISTVSMKVGSELTCEDTYLHCDGRLLMNVFGGCAFKAICWEATGAQAKVWYVAVPGPTPPPPPENK